MRLSLLFLVTTALGFTTAFCADPAPAPELSCAPSSFGEIQRGDSLVVTDPEAPCTIEFREVTRLRGADSVEVVDSPQSITVDSPPFLRGSTEMGMWSLEFNQYVFRRHGAQDFEVHAHVAREADSFPGPRGDIPATVSPNFAVDDRGMLWTLLSVPAPDAPAGPQPPAGSVEELRAVASRYRNTVIEVLTLDGRLLASRTYEDLRTVPRPITAERWYLVDNDPFPSIVIFEPSLLER